MLFLPFPVFYWISDFTFFLLYRVLGYRKKVVSTNLKNAFPHYSSEKLEHITVAFYRYLCDLFLETFKTLVISKSVALERCKLSTETKVLFDRYAQKNQTIVLVMGHYGNWEWAGNAFSLTCKQQLYVIYHPLANPYFDKLMYKMRTRFGTKLFAMKDSVKEIIKTKDQTKVIAFIADQTPPKENAYWTTFMNQDTPVFWGPEKIARKMNYPVIYTTVKKIKRGYYEIFAEELFANPSETAEGEISEAHTRRLETDITRQPETWLWSHRRWKHSRVVQNAMI